MRLRLDLAVHGRLEHSPLRPCKPHRDTHIDGDMGITCLQLHTETPTKTYSNSHRIHVWNIYLHLPWKSTKRRYIFYTCSIYIYIIYIYIIGITVWFFFCDIKIYSIFATRPTVFTNCWSILKLASIQWWWLKSTWLGYILQRHSDIVVCPWRMWFQLSKMKYTLEDEWLKPTGITHLERKMIWIITKPPWLCSSRSSSGV